MRKTLIVHWIVISSIILATCSAYAEKPCQNSLHPLGQVTNPETGAKARLLSRVTPDNIQELFSFEVKPGVFYAKSVASIYQGGGESVVTFLSQGENGIGNSIHHRDVLAAALEFGLYEEAEKFEKFLDVYFSSNVQMHKKILRNYNEARFQQDARSSLADIVTEAVIGKVPDRTLNHQLIGDPRFLQILQLSQGFQMTAKPDAQGKLKITELKVDSGITSLQKRYIDVYGARLPMHVQFYLAYQTIMAIDPSLFAQSLRIPELCYQLNEQTFLKPDGRECYKTKRFLEHLFQSAGLGGSFGAQ